MIIYPLNYLFYRVNVNYSQNVQITVYTLPVWEYYYKSVHQPIPTRENREHPGNFQNKSVSSAFNWVLPFYFLKWNCYFSACKRKFLKAQVSFPSNSASVFSSIKLNSPILFFTSNIIYFVQKKPIKVQIFEIFEWSDQTSSNSSC